MKILNASDRYIARLIAIPLLATLVIAAMLLVLDKMLRLFDFVAAEGGPVDVVWKMLGNLLPQYLGVGIPIALMLGILLAFRRLALSSEIDIFRAVGQSYFRLLRVPFLYAITLAAVNVAIVGFLQPYALYYYEQLRYDLQSGALGASIKVGEFNKLGDDITLRVEESRENGSRLGGLFVDVRNPGKQSFTVTAQRGNFKGTEDKDVILLRLENGTLVHESPDFPAPRVFTFSSYDLPIDIPELKRFRLRGGEDREYTFGELLRVGSDPDVPQAVRNEVRANFHFRAVEVATLLLLPFFALALALPPKRSTSALGVFVSVVILVTFHKIFEYGESVAGLGRVNPILALWGPFLLFALLTARFYYVAAHVPGGQPIGGLERAAAKIGKALGRLLKIRRHKSEAAA